MALKNILCIFWKKLMWFWSKKLSKKTSIYLFLNYVVTNENYFCINDTLAILKELPYHNLKIKFSMLEPEGIGDDKRLIVDLSKASEYIKNAIDIFDSKGINVYWDGYPLCFFQSYLHKRADLQTENIRYITEVYEAKIYNTNYGNRVFLDACQNCILKQRCYGVFGKYKKYFSSKSLTHPVYE